MTVLLRSFFDWVAFPGSFDVLYWFFLFEVLFGSRFPGRAAGEKSRKEWIARCECGPESGKEADMKKRNKTAFFDSQVDSALERAKLILCFVMIWGMLAHGFMLFNKFSFHDDPTMLFGSGFLGFLNLGRWMTDFLEIIACQL